jgi:hypothetical protein
MDIMIYGMEVPLYILIALVGLCGFLFRGWGQPPTEGPARATRRRER